MTGQIVRLRDIKVGDLIALTLDPLGAAFGAKPKPRWFRVVPPNTAIASRGDGITITVPHLPDEPDLPVLICTDRRRKKGDMAGLEGKNELRVALPLNAPSKKVQPD
jgi:hypothetical protein